MKTKQEFGEEARKKYWAKVQGTATNALVDWSTATHEKLIVLEREVKNLKDTVKKAEVARSAARIAYRKDFDNAETLGQWHESVATLKAGQGRLHEKRIEKNETLALSELLTKELKGRRDNQVPLTAEEQSLLGRKKRRRKSGVKMDSTVVETCPFCSHEYTVRDGIYPKLDAMGRPLQLWKCQCREMAPPCRNCPKCKENPEIMALSADEQLPLCREKEACEICLCECPGGGKWIQGDEASREKYWKKAVERHETFSGCIKASSDGAHQLPKRLPADLKNQIEAVHTLLNVDGHRSLTEEVDCQSKHCVACKHHQ